MRPTAGLEDNSVGNVGRLDKEQPGTSGGLLTSKPTWWKTSGCSATSALFVRDGLFEAWRYGDESTRMLSETIQAELLRLQLHPVNLDVGSESGGNILLKGSLIKFWDVPTSIDGQWFLSVLKGLPDNAGPQATMNAYSTAHSALLASRAST